MLPCALCQLMSLVSVLKSFMVTQEQARPVKYVRWSISASPAPRESRFVLAWVPCSSFLLCKYLAHTGLHYVSGSEIASSSHLEIVSDGTRTQGSHWAPDCSNWLTVEPWLQYQFTSTSPSQLLCNEPCGQKGGTIQGSHFRFYFGSILHTLIRTDKDYVTLQGADDHSLKSKFRPLLENIPCLQMSSNRNLWIIAWYLFWTLA